MIALMYHDVYKDNPKESGFRNDSASQYKVKFDQFENQVQSIAEYCRKAGREIRDVVEFTFDDGGVSFLTLVAPVLERYNLRGVFFISTKYIGSEGFLSQEMIKELSERGHTIGSHSHSHPKNISKLTYDEMVSEWKESMDVLSAILGKTVDMASIPNGFSSKDVLTACHYGGARIVYTSKPTTSCAYAGGVELRGRYVVHNTTDAAAVVKLVSEKAYRASLYMKYIALSSCKFLFGNYYDRIKALIVRK